MKRGTFLARFLTIVLTSHARARKRRHRCRPCGEFDRPSPRARRDRERGKQGGNEKKRGTRKEFRRICDVKFPRDYVGRQSQWHWQHFCHRAIATWSHRFGCSRARSALSVEKTSRAGVLDCVACRMREGEGEARGW